MLNKNINELFKFISNSPTSFHTIEATKTIFEENGFLQLFEGEKWSLKAGGKYFVIRNNSAIIGFKIPKDIFNGFQIIASHSDSPMFKIKENPEIFCEGHYVKLNVEKYGGMIVDAWFDRPLSIAGRVVYKTHANEIATKLIDIDKNVLLIPNLAIHMSRGSGKDSEINFQKELLPLYGDYLKAGKFLSNIAKKAKVKVEDILSYDLYVYNHEAPTVWGEGEQFISSPRLDDLQCAFASVKALVTSDQTRNVAVCCIFDNEEVGSSTINGAASTFLADSLERICEAFDYSANDYKRFLTKSFMISADNAHALHPNYPEKACPTNRPFLNNGIVIKYSANQKYTTDGIAAAIFKQLCDLSNSKYQIYHNNSNVLGGSTLGNISTNQVAVKCVDIGLPQLAMHSPYETAGVKDMDYLIKVSKLFYEASINEYQQGKYRIEI